MANPTDADDDTTTSTTRRGLLAAAGATGAAAVTLGGSRLVGEATAQVSTDLTVRIENVSTPSTLETTAGEDSPLSEQAVPLSPGAFAVHDYPAEPIFSDGEPERNNGLEEIAEGGVPSRLAATLANQQSVSDSGAFTTPDGAAGPGPIGPGGAYEFTVDVEGAAYLSFATMFIPSNDLFYAPSPTGIRLTEGADVRTGNFTDAVALWDAGTEVNQEPGVGDNQVQRQRGGPGSNVGDVEREVVSPVAEINGYDYPAVDEVLELTIEE